jgi:hypothetical protein
VLSDVTDALSDARRETIINVMDRSILDTSNYDNYMNSVQTQLMRMNSVKFDMNHECKTPQQLERSSSAGCFIPS